MENQNYNTLEDFILSESFKNYVLNSDNKDIAFWSSWIASHPEKEREFYQAVEVLKVLLNARKRPISANKHEGLKNLLTTLEYNTQKSKRLKTSFLQSQWLRIAAIVLVAIVFAVIWISYKPSDISKELAFNEIIVPIGEKAQVILADNTHVWINSGSRFKYPVKYDSQSREVFLEGEAYFDVTKQHGKPFIVNTKDIKIRVLGTAFKVKNYPKDRTSETTVVRGLVKVESALAQNNSVLVNPNEMAIFVKESKQIGVASTSEKPDEKPLSETSLQPIVISKINPEAVTCWKDQQLVFTDETLEDMVVKMERWYNIKIQLKDTTLLNQRYNGKFVHNETVYQVLEAIQLTTPINYRVLDNNIIITRKQK